MKKKVLIILILLITTNLTYTIMADAEPDITAESAIVLDQSTGRILYEKNINEKKPMASTTKIMTAIVAIENGNMNDNVQISKEASEIGGSSIWLEEDEELTLEELLYGMMLKSGNDASYAIGEHIGEGDINNFIVKMNKKAIELRALNTSYKNTHGLDQDGHYTTAHDLARISAYGMRNQNFRSIVSTKERNIPWSDSQWNRHLKNTNKMLWMYEGGNGIKTGFTNKAGKCLVSSACKNHMELVSVVLHSNDTWSDSKAILDFVYDNYSPLLVMKKDELIKDVEVVNGMEGSVKVYCKDDIIIPIKDEEKKELKIELSLPNQIAAPTMKEQIVGNLKVYIGEELIKEQDLHIKESIRKRTPNLIFKKLLKYWKDVS